MTIPVHKLLQGRMDPLEGATAFDFSARDFGGCSIPEPVRLRYTAQPENGLVRLDYTAEAVVETECGRCLAPVNQKWELEQEYTIRQADLLEEFPELPFTPDGGLDLEELVYGDLLMNIPAVLLCRQDCPGLCAGCGKPADHCVCDASRKDASQGDPRLQVLKQLLSDDSEESGR